MGMPNSQLGGMTMGHGCFPPTTSIVGSMDVFVNMIAEVRTNDMYAPHCCGPVCHPAMAMAGSTTTAVNGMMAHMQNSPLNCGDKLMMGSMDVFTG